MASGVVVTLGALALGAPVDAATFEVANLDDSGAGSLRDAIGQANAAAGADIVTFQAGLTGTIMLTSGEIDGGAILDQDPQLGPLQQQATAEIPTLGDVGKILLGGLVALAGFLRLRRH